MNLRRFPRLVLMLAVLAIALRALVPMGYMPETGKAFHVTICTMDGPQVLTVDKDFKPVPASHEAKPTKCEFSLLHHTPFAKAEAFAFILAAPFQERTSGHFVLNSAVRSRIIHAQAQPRAPPATV